MTDDYNIQLPDIGCVNIPDIDLSLFDILNDKKEQ